jgi:protein CpxP
MKTAKILIPAVLTAIMFSTATFSYADDTNQAKHQARMQERMAEMQKELALTPEQISQIKALHELNKEKSKASRQAMKKEIDAILTPEQLEKAKALREERKEKRKNKASES